MSFILLFDIPKGNRTLATRVFRNLRRINAEMVQYSAWRSDSLEDLMEIAMLIKFHGGSARILEEKFIF